MLNEIIKGISMKLNLVFGDGCEIYQNNVEQGLKEPCFFIAVLKPEVTPLIGQRCIRLHPFDIQYFPAASGKNDEMFSVADRLLSEMDFITLPNGDLLHGTRISYEVVDGVLHFFVQYNMTVMKQTEKTPMDALTTRVKTQ